MTTDEAKAIIAENEGRRGPKSKQYKVAELQLIKEGEMKVGGAAKKEEKKPALVMEMIYEAENIPESQQISIYMEALRHISDKRNFSFDHYIVAKYGVTKTVMAHWENTNAEMRRLRTVATDYMEFKLLDSINDKYSGGNPIGNITTLKAVFGYNDRGDGGLLMVDGNIDIVSNGDEDDEDYEDVQYFETKKGDEDEASKQ